LKACWQEMEKGTTTGRTSLIPCGPTTSRKVQNRPVSRDAHGLEDLCEVKETVKKRRKVNNQNEVRLQESLED